MSCCGGEERAQRAISRAIDKQIAEDERLPVSVMVLGSRGAGKTTIVKQMKILHDGYTDQERYKKVPDILRTVKEIILDVLRALPRLEPAVEVAEEGNIERVKHLLDVLAEPGFEKFTPELLEIVEKVWQDDGVKTCCLRSNEYQCIENAEYFVNPDKLKEVSQPDFKPSDQDILRCHELPSGFLQTTFAVERVNFCIFEVGMQRRRWFQYFGDITAYLFVVSCSSFETDINGTNELKESMDLFEVIWHNRWLRSVSAILFLNKQDEFKRKIDREEVKLEDYFPDFIKFNPPIDTQEPEESLLFTRAKKFIRDQFVKISMKSHDGRHFCYPHFTTAIDSENIRRVFDSCRDIINRKHLMKHELL